MDQKELSLSVKTIIQNINDNGGEIDFEAINDILPKDMPIGAIENVIDLLFELKDEETKVQIVEKDQEQEIKSDESNALARYVQIVSGIKKLSSDQENEIIDTIEGGNDRAKTLLIEAYLPLVLNIAREKGNNRDEILDFIQDGNIALMTAVDNYKSNGNRTFRDYARWSIRKAITKSERQASASLNLPKKITKFFKEFKIISNGMKSRLNRLPELSEIASAMNMPQSEVQKKSFIRWGTFRFRLYIR